jgi:4-alpha-glucanotransferase
VSEGLLDESDLSVEARAVPGRVDFAAAAPARLALLERAYRNFLQGRGGPDLAPRVKEFCEREAGWLLEFSLFYALKAERNGTSWVTWEEPLRRRDEGALAQARERLAEAIDRNVFVQFIFFDQWRRVRERARELNIQIVGDIPIFVADDSADVWANPDLFDLDDSGLPRAVAGVPPDYFSRSGQRWGNPLYRWETHRAHGFAWWLRRMRASLALYDRLRIDHFRGFYDYWEIPAAEPTAVNGRWVLGPGASFFEALEGSLGKLPIIAEDLGELHGEVYALRDRFEFPGMRVLHFGFARDPRHDGHSPHQFVTNCVAYTGTHDNDTTRGWFHGAKNNTLSESERVELRHRVLRYLGKDGSEIHWDLIRLASMSVADTCIVPMQDVLGLGSEARMNVPGTASGNWTWRLNEGQWTEETIGRLRELTFAYGR